MNFQTLAHNHVTADLSLALSIASVLGPISRYIAIAREMADFSSEGLFHAFFGRVFPKYETLNFFIPMDKASKISNSSFENGIMSSTLVLILTQIHSSPIFFT